MAMALFLFVTAVALLATLVVRVAMMILKGNQMTGFSDVHIDVGLALGACKRLLDSLHLFCREAIREDDFECNKQVSKLVGLLVVRHAVAFDCLDVIGLDDLARLVLDSDFAAIQMSKYEVNSSQGLKQGNLLLYHQVSTSSLEGLLWLFINLNDYISRLDVWVLIGLSMENLLFSIRSAFVNSNLKDFLLFDDLLSFAGLTFVLLIDHLSLTLAFITRPSALRVHARTELLHVNSHAFPFAARAGRNGSRLTALAIALGADAITVYNHLGSLAIVKISKCRLDRVEH